MALVKAVMLIRIASPVCAMFGQLSTLALTPTSLNSQWVPATKTNHAAWTAIAPTVGGALKACAANYLRWKARKISSSEVTNKSMR